MHLIEKIQYEGALVSQMELNFASSKELTFLCSLSFPFHKLLFDLGYNNRGYGAAKHGVTVLRS